MQPITKSAKSAIYIKGADDQKIQMEIAKLKEYITNDGNSLAGPEHIYVDGDGSLKQLAKLAGQASKYQIRVVYVVHDLLAGERQQYRVLVNKLYTQAVSILICE